MKSPPLLHTSPEKFPVSIDQQNQFPLPYILRESREMITVTYPVLLWLWRTTSLHVISCLCENWLHVPKFYIFLSCLIRKILHVPRSNQMKLGNMVKFSTFFIAWSKMLCCGPRFLEVVSPNYQAAKSGRLFTAQTNQAAMLDFSHLVKWSSIRLRRCVWRGLLSWCHFHSL